MSRLSSKVDFLESLITEKLADSGIEIVDIEYKKENHDLIIRVYIDTDEGVNIDSCTQASRIIKRIIDEHEDELNYDHLEVSSPGIDRKLKKERDFVKYNGERVKLKTIQPIEKQKKFIGFLDGFDAENIYIRVEEQTLKIPRNLISTVRLFPDI